MPLSPEHSVNDSRDVWMNYSDHGMINSNKTAESVRGFGPIANYTEFWVAYYLNLYYPWCLCGLGVLCNLVVFAVTLVSKPFNTSSMYVATLAVVDSLALVAKLLYTSLTADDVPMGHTGCQIILLIGHFLVQFSVWILAIITVERFVAVQFVFKVSSLFTMARARMSLAITAVLLFLADIHLFWTSMEVSDPLTGLQCGFHPDHQFFGNNVWHWIDATLAFLFPCALLIVLNTLILVYLHRHQAKNKEYFSGNEDIPKRARNQNRQLTVMLVTVSVGTTCLLLPISVFYVVHIYWNYIESAHSTAQVLPDL
ncbi:thyrotropin-releasing hormone receptor-like [Liolophura sinensis]|uniref:thyrotropin-releasing hormone receptor-like n=1 Tax=Liolophura sinensis TaxID=3198878 RepID=UPI0031598E38